MPGRNVIPGPLQGRKAGLSPAQCLLWGLRSERQLCSATRWVARGRCVSSHCHQGLHKAFIQRHSPGCAFWCCFWLIGLPVRRLFPCQCTPIADPAAVQCHSEGTGRILHSREKRQCSGWKDPAAVQATPLSPQSSLCPCRQWASVQPHLLMQGQLTRFHLWKLQTAQSPGTAVQGSVCPGGKGRRRGEICFFKITSRPGLFIPWAMLGFASLFFQSFKWKLQYL